MRERVRWDFSPEVVAAHGGARVASEGFAPHSHHRPVYVVGGGVVLTDPLFRRDGPGRIWGLLDGPNCTGPLSRRNYEGWARFEGAATLMLRRAAWNFSPERVRGGGGARRS